ncbi:unnamed protein product [Symbiodinium sp. CCMP2592]|nr:unnamed protein product [Symbiodinium sp. CCMP2592]
METRPAKRARGDVQCLTPEKSPNDALSYRLLAFPNGFEALLVSCDDAKKGRAAASVAVAAGSFSDPGSCQGLAHYLEHMLFMGSSKYPGEDEMESFLAKNGGSSNAFTDCEHTCYYFDVNKTELHTAVDMLAQFFIAPLLKTDSAERELNAIESEFRLTQNADDSRVEALYSVFAKERHPFRNFGWGNLRSLKEEPAQKGVDINEELRKFFLEHYQAPQLRLCVYGVESLDDLETLVVTSFSVLPCGSAPQRAERGLPFEVQCLPLLLRVRPVQDTHKLCIAWQLPRTQHLYLSKPLNYVAHLTGHEGAGSLQAWLKSQGLATEVDAGVSDEDDWNSNAMCSMFSIGLTLTERGLCQWPEVVHAVFLYISMMIREGPQKWIHDELVQAQDVGWRFLEETDPMEYVQKLACQMLPDLQRQREHLLKSEWMLSQWDPDGISEFLRLMVPRSCFIVLLSSAYGRAKGAQQEPGKASGDQEAEGEEEETLAEDPEVDLTSQSPAAADPHFDPQAQTPSVEPHFKTEYWKAGPEEVSRWMGLWESSPGKDSLAADAAKQMRLPDRNPFLATNFELCPAPAEQESSVETWLSELGVESESSLRSIYGNFPKLPRPPQRPVALGAGTWHLQETVLQTPRSEVWLKLSVPWPSLGLAVQQARLALLARVLSDSLNEVSYLAEQASLDLRIRDELYGLDVRVGGFHEKLPLLLHAALEQLKLFGSPSAWQERLDSPQFLRRCSAQREELLRSLRNEYTKPGDHCADLRRSMVMASRTLATERADALEALQVTDLAAFAQELIPQLDVEVLFIGNATSEDARQLVAAFPAELRPKAEALAHVPHPPARVVRVPVAEPLVWVEDSHDTGNRNVAVEMYWQLGPVGSNEAKDAAQVELLADLIAEPLFDSLRTKQQIGYVASCGARWTHRVQGFSVWLMSSKFGPAEICRRALKFLADFQKTLEDMPEEDFAQHVCSLAAQKLEPDRTLNSIQAVAWAELQERNHLFDRSWREALALAALSRRELLELLRELQGSKRLVVAAVVGGRAKPQPK